MDHIVWSPALPDFKEHISIDGRTVGRGHACYIIAEAGSNHNGNLETALALVDAAAHAGCDAVKFQTFKPEEIASAYANAETKLPESFFKWGRNLLELYRHCALPESFHAPLAARARERGIHFFSSPFSEKSVDLLVELGVPVIKIASFELVHLPLIRYAASTGIPLIMSTGMAGLGDIEHALAAAARGGGSQIALLHCGSNYPLGAESAHLAAMETMRRAFGVPVGYSDHTLGIGVPIAAAALGASVLEKHFTLDRNFDGPDHSFAIEPHELSAMVREMRIAEQAVGRTLKKPQAEELPHVVRGRRSLFAARNIRAGETLAQEMVSVLRPGAGLESALLPVVIGAVVVRDIEAGMPLTWQHFLS